MKLKEVVKDVFSILILKNEVLYFSKKQIVSLSNNNTVNFSSIGNVRKNSSLVALIQENRIELYDSLLSHVATIENSEINRESGITLIDENNLVVHNFTKSDNIFYFKSGILVGVKYDFWGIVLNEKYVLNYTEGTFTNPRQFLCIDLLDEHTYWEYDCGDGYVAGRFYMWNETLVFSKSKDMDVRLVLINLATGNIDWEVKILDGSFFFDEQNGVLASIWGSKKEGGGFQIVHLDKRLVEIGTLEDFNMEYVRVNWQTQYLTNNKYYFTETVYTAGNEKPRPVKFGIFDIETKKIDYLQEVPGSAGHQFAQVIYHDRKLYLRSSANGLFILEDENSAMQVKV